MTTEPGPALTTRLRDVSLLYSAAQPVGDHGDPTMSWFIRAVEEIDEGGDSMTERLVGRIHIVTGDINHGHLWDVLDANEADLSTVASAVLDQRLGCLRDDLADFILGDRLVILNSVTLVDEWRGHGVGALLAGTALETFVSGAAIMATYPAPMDDAEGAARRAATKKLRAVWSRIGFAPYRDGVYVLDPAKVDLPVGLAAIRAGLGIDDDFTIL